MQLQALWCFKKIDEEQRTSRKLDKSIKSWIKPYKHAIKVLLLGAGEAGKTTVLKQMKILHIQGFSNEERKEKAIIIRKNIHEATLELSYQLDVLKIKPQSIQRELIEKLMNEDVEAFTEEYYDLVKIFWGDPAVKECLRRSNEFQLIDSAEYFLDRIAEVRKKDFIPTDADILHSRQRTSGIQKVEFKVKIPNASQQGLQEFWMFDVGGQRGERKKWIQVFEGIHAVWFLVASSDFDQTLREDQTQNRLKEAITLFEDVWKSRFLIEAGLILFLNKQDILKRKVEEGRDIGKYFPEYRDFSVDSSSDGKPITEYEKTKLFIKYLFVKKTQLDKRVLKSDLRGQSGLALASSRPRECYYHFTVATDTDNISLVFKDVYHVILTNVLADVGVL